MTLAEFIKARLDEVAALAEAAARCRGKYEWYPEPQIIADGLNLPDAQFIRYWDPARVLRQVVAIRAILAEHSSIQEGWLPDDYVRCQRCRGEERPIGRTASGGITAWPCRTVRLLAAIWEDHPDYDGSWKP